MNEDVIRLRKVFNIHLYYYGDSEVHQVKIPTVGMVLRQKTEPYSDNLIYDCNGTGLAFIYRSPMRLFSNDNTMDVRAKMRRTICKGVEEGYLSLRYAGHTIDTLNRINENELLKLYDELI